MCLLTKSCGDVASVKLGEFIIWGCADGGLIKPFEK